jgi:hypothetical protein
VRMVQKEGANAAAWDAIINITTHPAERDGNFRTVIGCLPFCQCDVIYIGAHLEQRHSARKRASLLLRLPGARGCVMCIRGGGSPKKIALQGNLCASLPTLG